MALRRCWWCGNPAEVDTELPESGGMVRDSETSWLCTDNVTCTARALDLMATPGFRRGQPESTEGETR